MNIHRFKPTLTTVLFSVSLLAGGAAVSDELDDIHQLNQQRTTAAKESQARIDKLDDERNELLEEYKSVNKVIEGLKVYNAQVEKRIANQESNIATLDESIAQALEMKRQITPLMVRMLEGLETFVALDVPFHMQEREERLAFYRDAMDDPDISDSEKFRQVLDGYQYESEYGRKIDAYTDTINLNGAEVNVNVLRIGRIALVAQTKDEATTLAWDNRARTWEVLPNSYRNAVRSGIRIARNQATIDMMMMPVPAPETAQ